MHYFFTSAKIFVHPSKIANLFRVLPEVCILEDAPLRGRHQERWRHNRRNLYDRHRSAGNAKRLSRT